MRTLSTAITTGYTNGSTPVLLIKVHTENGDGTAYYFSTLDDSNFTTWAGENYLPMVMRSSPTRHMSSVTREPGKSQLSEFNFVLQNPEYSGSTSLWDYLDSQEDYLTGAEVTVWLIYNEGSSLDEDDGEPIFKGICRKANQSLSEVSVYCQDISRTVHIDVPQTQINETDYPDWNDSGYGREDNLGKYFPICFGEGDFICHLYDTSGGYGYFQRDTWEQRTLGTLEVYDPGGGFRSCTDRMQSAGDKNGVMVGSADLNALLHFEYLIMPDSIESETTNGNSTDWTNEANAVDDDEATYANSAITAALTYPHITFTFDDLPFSKLSGTTGLIVRAKAESTVYDDDNWYFFSPGSVMQSEHAGHLNAQPYMGKQYWGADLHNNPPEYDGTEDLLFHSLSMDSLRDNYDSKISFWGSYFATIAQIKFYEFLGLVWNLFTPMNEEDFCFTGASGRIYDDTWNSRKTATAMIATFPDAIEAILRQECGLVTADIDTASFDAALTTLNAWSGKAYNDSTFEVSGQQLDRINSEDLITNLCKESGLHYSITSAGLHKLNMISTDRTADYTITEADIGKDDFDPVELSDHEELFNDFVINFDKHPVTGVYRQTITINRSSGIDSSDEHHYLQERCLLSWQRYGVNRQKTINCNWIASVGTAWKLMDWCCYFYCFVRKYVKFRAKSHGLLKVENMDVALIKHMLTDLSSGENFLMYESKTVNSKKKAYTEHKGMYIETMGDRDDGDPE